MSPKKTTHPAVSAPDPSLLAPCSLAGDASPSDPDVLRSLYAALLKTRLLEEQVLSLHRSGKLPGTIVPVLGGEATEIGACIGLQPGDTLSTSQPLLAAEVVRGTSLPDVFSRALHRSEPKAPAAAAVQEATWHVIPTSASLVGQLDVAAGVALAYRQLRQPNVVVALLDDGLAALGFWHQAAHLASRHRLPILFMIENCQQSHAFGSSSVQSDADLRDRAEAYGIPGITVDGNDIVAVWRVTQESIHRARTGAGPTLIECRTWRWHAETDKTAPNGNASSKQSWQNDPLHHMEHYMKKRRLWDNSRKDALTDQYRAALKRALAAAQKLPQ